MATIVEGNPKAPFSIATTPRCRGGRYSFPGLLYFTLDAYLIMLSVKQGGIKYHFLSLWYDSTWDWTQVSRAIGEHSNRLTTTFEDVFQTLEDPPFLLLSGCMLFCLIRLVIIIFLFLFLNWPFLMGHKKRLYGQAATLGAIRRENDLKILP